MSNKKIIRNTSYNSTSIEDKVLDILKNVNDTRNKTYQDIVYESTTTENIVDPDADIKGPAFNTELTTDQIKEIAKEMFYAQDEIDRTDITTGGGVKSGSNSTKNSSNSENGEESTSFLQGVSSTIDSVLDLGVDSVVDLITQYLGKDDKFAGTLIGIARTIEDGLADYKDGVTETNFGELMEESWVGTNNSFLNHFESEYKSVAAESRKIKIMNSTPMDPGDSRSALFGSMVLGTPYTFNDFADPQNRSFINSFIKDGKILSLTPGMPKYNGLTSYGSIKNSILNQTTSAEEMLQYLNRNGLDSTFSTKDKRYYTFEAKYEEYFAYLETMLNTIWIKLGLGKEGETFNIFSFFDIRNDDGSITASNTRTLKPQYNSSIGFFTNIDSVSESIDSQLAGFGDQLAAQAKENARTYQQMNYITGMGTGGGLKNMSRKIGIGITSAKQIGNFLASSFNGTIGAISGTIQSVKGADPKKMIAPLVKGVASIAANVANDVSTLVNTQDLNAVIQSFATSNGMMVSFPDLWTDSSYAKNLNFNFSFTSPYGDPLSIFKYVYVPFCALLCFALPRQAAENGYVSPFLVRADVPGLITSDLAMVTSLTWQKGGANALWTKDGLPRSITCSITVSDLYPYLAMTKRLSFLSANPSFTVFLDNMTGMCALNDTDDSDAINEYFLGLIDRVNGVSNRGASLWNKFNSAKVSESIRSMNSARNSVSGRLSLYSIPWMHNSSLF